MDHVLAERRVRLVTHRLTEPPEARQTAALTTQR